MVALLKPRLHEQIKPPLIAQILDPYEVTPYEFALIKYVLFAHVNAALGNAIISVSQNRKLIEGKFFYAPKIGLLDWKQRLPQNQTEIRFV